MQTFSFFNFLLSILVIVFYIPYLDKNADMNIIELRSKISFETKKLIGNSLKLTCFVFVSCQDIFSVFITLTCGILDWRHLYWSFGTHFMGNHHTFLNTLTPTIKNQWQLSWKQFPGGMNLESYSKIKENEELPDY